jgi:hypothetical protein
MELTTDELARLNERLDANGTFGAAFYEFLDLHREASNVLDSSRFTD